MSADALKTFAAALAKIDHEPGNAAVREIRAQIAHAEGKIAAVREEANRLSQQIAAYRGPDANAVAAAVLAGAELDDATFASESRRDLAERREALTSSLKPISAHIDELRHALFVAEGRARQPMVDAAKAYAEHLRERQRNAAEELVEIDAALVAIGSGLQCHVEGAEASRQAREGVTGDRSILGWRDVLNPPGDLLAVLQPLADASDAVRGFPAAIPLR